MYIGPWQEYNLSKSKVIYQKRINQTLKNDIEQAILNSLDPDTAKVALAAVNPYFKENNFSSIPQRPNQQSPTSTQLHGRIIRKRYSNTNSLPPIQASNVIGSSYALSARDRNLSSASPVSTVRTTQSEPIKISQTINHSESKLPNLDSTKSTVLTKKSDDDTLKFKRQPPYNAPAMLHLLRQERNTNARTKIAKLTGWNININESSSNANNMRYHENEKKRKLQINNDNKLEQVNMMKQLYLSGGINSTVPIESNTLKLPAIVSSSQHIDKPHAVQTHNIMQTQPRSSVVVNKMSVPLISDFDLTDADLNLVSKYFQENNEQSRDHDHHNQISIAAIDPKEENFSIYQKNRIDSKEIVSFNDEIGSEYSTNHDYSDENGSTNYSSQSKTSINPDHNVIIENSQSVVKSKPITAEQHGIEGLLNWSKELDLDML